MSGYERRSLIQNNPCYNERINRNSLVFRLNTEVSSGRSSLWRNRFQDDVIAFRNPRARSCGRRVVKAKRQLQILRCAASHRIDTPAAGLPIDNRTEMQANAMCMI